MLTYSHPKVVEGVHVDLLDLVEQLEGVVGHGGHVAEVDPVAGVGRESGCRHVSGARALDFLDAAVAWKEEGGRKKVAGNGPTRKVVKTV